MNEQLDNEQWSKTILLLPQDSSYGTQQCSAAQALWDEYSLRRVDKEGNEFDVTKTIKVHYKT